MSENVQIVLIIAAAVVIIVIIAIFVLKDKIQSGQVEASRKSVKGSLKIHTPSEPSVTKISGTKIKGNKNEVHACDGAQLEESDIEGDENRLNSENA